jgi:hypothetical protein
VGGLVTASSSRGVNPGRLRRADPTAVARQPALDQIVRSDLQRSTLEKVEVGPERADHVTRPCPPALHPATAMDEGVAKNPEQVGLEPPSSAGRAQLARVFLWALGFACAGNLLLVLASAPAGSPLLIQRPGDAKPSVFVLAQALGSLLFLFTAVLAAVAFLVWIHGARSRQRWLVARPGSDISPARSVLVWFLARVCSCCSRVRDGEGWDPRRQP